MAAVRMSLLALCSQTLQSFVVCWDARVVYWHVAKTAGSTLRHLLLEHGCTWYALGMSHLTPQFLYEAPSALTAAFQSDAWRADEVRLFRSFAFVRNPYIRVLSAYDEILASNFTARELSEVARQFGLTHFGVDRGSFVTFMEWLWSLHNGSDIWHVTLFAHFRPATLYTHWPNGSLAITSYGRFETFKSDLRALSSYLLPSLVSAADGRRGSIPRLLDRGAGRGRASLCQDANGCFASEFDDVVQRTWHTKRTLQIVNLLYHRDFTFLGYRRFAL
eukprot:TRINITY_DN59155_c0_g1_i1.p1 TRINITY_DN59155_c0_g1~~TRINITY_DN59155_c0_g1_i1.p1  ORF type:complete len:276 (+),score=16.62 TRINITY_DN59155_c0_g1_i1:197-1024(+)